jgi:serine protease Do
MSVRSLNWLKFGGLVALAFALGLLFAGLLDLPRRGSAQQLVQNAGTAITPVAAPSIPQAKPLADLSDAFAAVADAVVPSVVYIRAQRQESATQRRLPPGLEQFFGPQREPGLQQGSGSGFVVSADGYILTNNHVVEGAERVIVRLHDRREFDAKVVGTDPNTDVAVLKIDATDLKPAALGNSDDEKIGEWVLAVGNPLSEGLTFTVTSGIISAKGRRLDELPGRTTLNISDFIQTDAAINPGNSGGPLVNVRGEVIGVNSAIASQTGTYTGYGFAIPINLVRDVMRQLISDGRVHRAGIGITIEEASRFDAQYVGLDRIRGVLVQTLAGEDSPAGRAGILPGDVIIAVDGKPIDRVGQLQQEIGFREPGQTVRIEVARKGGVRKTFDVRLQALDAPELARGDSDSVEAEGAASTSVGVPQALLGARVQQVTPALAQRLGLPAGSAGLLLADVTPGGPAWEAGLAEPGRGFVDIIRKVEGRAVTTEADLTAALRRAGPNAVVSLDVLRVLGDGSVNPYIRRLRLADSPR